MKLPYVNAEPVTDSKPWVGTLEMFEKPPRARPRVMMHWDDAGCDARGHFICRECKYAAWYSNCTTTDFKRGIPCPVCNKDSGLRPHR